MMQKNSVMICTVGGTVAPLRESINYHKPTHIIFVASQESRKMIANEIMSQINYPLVDSEKITLCDFQDLIQCVRDIRENVPKKLSAMSLPENTPLIADITGGTKIMSAALTLAMMEFSSHFSYVGGTVRNKEGLGVVESGSEIVRYQANPWDVLALREVQALCHSFNNGQFYDAKISADKLASHIDDKSKKNFYEIVAVLIHGYMLWDRFSHKKALSLLRQACERFQPYTMHSQLLSSLVTTIDEHVGRLKSVQSESRALKEKQLECPGKAYLLDLLANARRRAEQGHFDDAVARLYSAIEKSAKIALWTRHAIDNSNVDINRIPQEFRNEYESFIDKDGKLKIGLQQSFFLLERLGDDLGKTYVSRQQELENQLKSRNESLLAHGYVPIEREKYQNLFSLSLNFLNTEERELVVFPQINWKALLL